MEKNEKKELRVKCNCHNCLWYSVECEDMKMYVKNEKRKRTACGNWAYYD